MGILEYVISKSHNITDKRAAKNPLWKERRDRRRTDSGTIRFLDEEFTMDHWNEEHEIWKGYRPWWGTLAQNIKWWLEKHGPRQLLRQHKWNKQRIKRGFSDLDLWGFDHFLAQVIRDGVLELDRIKHGWPGEPMTFEEWGQVLRNIADGMDAAITVQNLDYDYKDPSVVQELEDRRQKGFALFSEYFLHLWD
jgi:hypothetical protein